MGTECKSANVSNNMYCASAVYPLYTCVYTHVCFSCSTKHDMACLWHWCVALSNRPASWTDQNVHTQARLHAWHIHNVHAHVQAIRELSCNDTSNREKFAATGICNKIVALVSQTLLCFHVSSQKVHVCYLYMYTCTCTCIYIYIYTWKCIHTYMYIRYVHPVVHACIICVFWPTRLLYTYATYIYIYIYGHLCFLIYKVTECIQNIVAARMQTSLLHAYIIPSLYT